jgi:hypothetical protein
MNGARRPRPQRLLAQRDPRGGEAPVNWAFEVTGYRDLSDPHALAGLRNFTEGRLDAYEGVAPAVRTGAAWLRRNRLLLPWVSVLALLVASVRDSAADRAAGRAQCADRADARQPRDDQGGRAGRAWRVVLACQDGLAAVPARDDEIISSTGARQSSR